MLMLPRVNGIHGCSSDTISSSCLKMNLKMQCCAITGSGCVELCRTIRGAASSTRLMLLRENESEQPVNQHYVSIRCVHVNFNLLTLSGNYNNDRVHLTLYHAYVHLMLTKATSCGSFSLRYSYISAHFLPHIYGCSSVRCRLRKVRG